MMTICVTGAFGFLGWHVRAYMHGLRDVETIALGRKEFEDDETLRAALRRCDAVVHCAGVNRAEDAVMLRENPRLACRLAEACEELDRTPHVVYTTSIHEDRNTSYGRSKREAGQILQKAIPDAGGRYTALVLPHVFGEHATPFYNSVVATFCHQLVSGEESEIRDNGHLELVHAQDVAERILDSIREKSGGRVRVKGVRMTVREVHELLMELLSVYRDGVFPNVRDHLSLGLFNTLRSYLFPGEYPVEYDVKSDNRGFLFELCKSKGEGQVFVSSTEPGVTRGEHYHRRKIERFSVIRGEAVIRIRRLLTGDHQEFSVVGSRPAFVDIPTLHTHNITNTGRESLMTAFFSNDIYEPDDPDTYPESVR